MSETDAALVILCGGRGTRMGGKTKPLLYTQNGRGPTVLEVIERTLGPHAAATYLLAPEELAPELSRVSRAKLVVDRGRGPGEAVLDGSRMITQPWLFVVAGDQPRPSLRLYERLSAIMARDGADAVAVAEGGEPCPTFTFYRRDALMSITRVGGERGLSLRDALGALETATIAIEDLDEDERAALEDADTPEAAARLGLAFDPVRHR